MAHAFVGAVFGIVLTALVMRLWLGGHVGSLPLLVAPMGASAVLLFGVPASPLAQPWAIVGGNTVSALCGIACARLVGDPALAAGLAVAGAIVMMSLLRCLHPPGGAVALTCVIGGPVIAAAGWSFAFVPVALDCLLLVGAGLLYNVASHGNYPHHARRFTTQAPAPVGYTLADLQSVLDQYDALLDVRSEDLDTLFRQVESRAYRRLHGVVRCEQIMRRDVPTIAMNASPEEARALLIGHDRLVVIDDRGHVEGVLRARHMDNGTMVRMAMDASLYRPARDRHR
jgi:CBS domain-containing membrane protein